MKVFELYFNPKGKQNSIFDSFIYDSEIPPSGNLCMAGELTQSLPQNSALMDNLANVIKDGLFAKNEFSDALKEANAFLEKEAKSGNVNWLGNINFAVLNIGGSVLNFAKVGDVKILLLRQGEVLDISQNLELQDQEPYPMKVFSNIASGKLLPHDKIAVLTDEVFQIVSQNDAFLNQLNLAASEKDIKQIFKINKGIFAEASGLCILISKVHESGNDSQEAFKLPNIFPKIAVPKKLILIIFFVIILAVAYSLFGSQKEKINNPSSGFEKNLQLARSKISMAENFIIIKKNEKAQALFQEAWDILQPIKTQESLSLQESIKKYIILTPQ